MDRQTFNNLISAADFKQLFIEELGWNNPKGQTQLPDITIGEATYRMTCIAQMSGFQVLTCATDRLPAMTLCRTIDSRLRRQADSYICIFTHNSELLHHLWLCPIVTTEKRDTVIVDYDCLEHAEFLYQKMQSLYFPLGAQVTIVDVKQRVHQAFAVNSERITKDFYRGFQQQHRAFADFISGIDDHINTRDNRQKQWYTSVMLNRLMFCYFIQKKGFLNKDNDYLAKKLRWVQQQKGAGSFYQSFYRGFLLRLFHGGLNQPTHDGDFEDRYGRIPYLNGGMFDLHQIERQYPDIDISDEAFDRLFRFFDQWQWHLDTRLTASGRDINPDVLGYIFEQYINDRAAMGAYYTKEDITEYIAKNCILPFLFDQVKASPSGKHFKADGYVWQTMQQSGKRYIYDAVLRGYSPDWKEKIPDYIANGISTTEPDLLDRRKRWNERTAPDFALPTEIWRETIERLQRCDTLISKISGGEVHETNDLITLNLNIRLFAQDLIDRAQDHLFVKHFYDALRRVTILDPTCGSGAFLFAALNILEPLYEGCIERMRQFNEQNSHLFVEELAEIDAKYRSNVQYFIYKSIILRNLYGVDIMAEATEIAKLRLFLKMVAVVDVAPDEPNLGLDPLPDVDFNIRCGNTLVGYANMQDVLNSVKYGDMFARQEFEERIEEELDLIAKTYSHFKALQLTQEENAEAYKQAKQDLGQRLRALNDTLNQQLHQATAPGTDYPQWLASHQPFHWIAEFYDIIHGNGGFDVIIGNPPYLEQRQINYSITGYQTEESGAVHVFCIERSLAILNKRGGMSMIVPLAIVCTQRMTKIQKLLESNRYVWYSNFSWRPAKLFDAVNRALSIFVANNSDGTSDCFTTTYMKWISDNRASLFSEISYCEYLCKRTSFWVPKLQNKIEISILNKILAQRGMVANLMTSKQNAISRLYYRTTGGLYWKVFTTFSPRFFLNGVPGKSSRETCLYLKETRDSYFLSALLSSTTFWCWYTITSNLRDLNPSDILGFKFSQSDQLYNKLVALGECYMKHIERNSSMLTREQKNKGTTQTQSFKIALSKPIIDEIDKALAKHYGFTDEELDFIINYDIKYRMGEELNGGEEDEG